MLISHFINSSIQEFAKSQDTFIIAKGNKM